LDFDESDNHPWIYEWFFPWFNDDILYMVFEKGDFVFERIENGWGR